MAIADKIPSVLYQSKGNSLSVERVLKKAVELLNSCSCLPDEEIEICIEDLETLIKNLDR